MSIILDLVGKRFGNLIIIKQVGLTSWGNKKWLCECDCGRTKVIQGGNLTSGHTGSCGCSHIKHGHNTRNKRSRTYLSWDSMIQRCLNPNCREYKHYGGRGISVDHRWKKFENFLRDMGKRPVKKSLDRIDNNKGYCLSNCRWATQKQQTRNTRRNCLKTFCGKTQCISAWAEEFGIPENTLRARFRYGWSVERALTESVR